MRCLRKLRDSARWISSFKLSTTTFKEVQLEADSFEVQTPSRRLRTLQTLAISDCSDFHLGRAVWNYYLPPLLSCSSYRRPTLCFFHRIVQTLITIALTYQLKPASLELFGIADWVHHMA